MELFCYSLDSLDSSILNLWTGPFQKEGMSGYFFIITCIITMFIQIPVFNANSVDPDQTPRSVSDPGLHCLSVSLLWDARHKWINILLLCFVGLFWYW